MKNSHVSRRQFLNRTVGAAVAAGAAPYVWLPSARGAANDQLNIACIGVGGRGSDIGHQAGRLFNMVACADVYRDNAEKFASKYDGKCEVYTDYRKVLDREDVDAITCGTPDHWHVRIAIDALEAGKHVYCEKPLTLTIEESRLIQDAVKKTGKTFQVGTQQRSEFGQMFLKAIAIARSGMLGDKLHAVSSVGPATAGGPFPTEAPPAALDFNFWLGQTPKVDFCSRRIGWDFRWWLEYSGGQVTDWGVHHTDIAMWALGGDEMGVVQAEGKGTFPGIPDGTDMVAFLNGKTKLPQQFNVAQTFDCDLTLANGNTIKLVSDRNELLLEGEKGRLRVNRGSLTGKIVEDINADPKQKEWLDEEVHKLYRNMPIQGHMANFLHCIKSGDKPISDVWTHCNSVNACHMANIAMFVKRKLQFDPATYQFVGDEEANRFLSRERRDDWG
ncbi:MAG: Gfo/Idh/MocA family oxidoreductase [Planctomycetales bacterium]|nr:Gfo/Idh/MocA family oxidoreductase [Planctomycetales bacterium]